MKNYEQQIKLNIHLWIFYLQNEFHLVQLILYPN